MFDKLFEPLRIKRMELRNRIVMPPMVVNFAGTNGSVSETNKNYYAARSKGGVGLIIVEATGVAKGGWGSPLQLRIDRDELVLGLSKLADAVHLHGAKIAIQIVHVGRQGRAEYLGQQPVGTFCCCLCRRRDASGIDHWRDRRVGRGLGEGS